MQTQRLHPRPLIRMPMLDVTNMQPLQATFDSLKLPSVPMTARAYTTMDFFEFSQCPHRNKIKAENKKFSNCADCGAFISNDGISTIREESKKCRIEVSPSVLLENMVRKQLSNRKHATVLVAREILTRKKLVDWLCEMGESIHVSPEYIHKAIVYLDVIMAENTIAANDLQPLGIICMLLAAKMGEKDKQVSQIKILFQQKMKVSASHIRKYEMQVLSLLNWDLQCVTPMDFLQLLIYQGILFTNDRVGAKPATSKLALTLRQYAEFFADMCLQEYKMLAIDPLHLATGIVAAARKMLKLEKVWRSELTAMTGVKYDEIMGIVDDIFKAYSKMFGKVKDNKENVGPKKTGITHTNSRNQCALPPGALRYV